MLIQALHKQNLIAQKNSLQYGLLQNWASQRSMLNGGYSPSFGSALELQGISDSIQLMAINAELNALNNAKMDYLA
ncbi:MAG: hypothetical protein IJ877_06235 [Candidatus Gastranaerophilales bacterium]|nr:hypothetical protein [Candidatus Gastranaerophilales bacterium]